MGGLRLHPGEAMVVNDLFGITRVFMPIVMKRGNNFDVRVFKIAAGDSVVILLKCRAHRRGRRCFVLGFDFQELATAGV